MLVESTQEEGVMMGASFDFSPSELIQKPMATKKLIVSASMVRHLLSSCYHASSI
jgi:hypothetical protein